MRRRLLLLGLAWLLPIAGAVAVAVAAPSDRPSSDQVPLGDLLEIVELDAERELIAIDAESGGTTTLRLRLGERVVWRDTRGLLGVVLTDERILGIATGSSSWQAVDYERGEAGEVRAELGDRVAIVRTPNRVLGFVGTTSRFSEARLGPHEKIVRTAVGANVAVAVTDRRALGLSPQAGGFFPVRMQLREEVSSVEVGSNLATIHTDQRILVFRGPTGTWAERRR